MVEEKVREKKNGSGLKGRSTKLNEREGGLSLAAWDSL